LKTAIIAAARNGEFDHQPSVPEASIAEFEASIPAELANPSQPRNNRGKKRTTAQRSVEDQNADDGDYLDTQTLGRKKVKRATGVQAPNNARPVQASQQNANTMELGFIDAGANQPAFVPAQNALPVAAAPRRAATQAQAAIKQQSRELETHLDISSSGSTPLMSNAMVAQPTSYNSVGRNQPNRGAGQNSINRSSGTGMGMGINMQSQFNGNDFIPQLMLPPANGYPANNSHVNAMAFWDSNMNNSFMNMDFSSGMPMNLGQFNNMGGNMNGNTSGNRSDSMSGSMGGNMNGNMGMMHNQSFSPQAANLTITNSGMTGGLFQNFGMGGYSSSFESTEPDVTSFAANYPSTGNDEVQQPIFRNAVSSTYTATEETALAPPVLATPLSEPKVVTSNTTHNLEVQDGENSNEPINQVAGNEMYSTAQNDSNPADTLPSLSVEQALNQNFNGPEELAQIAKRTDANDLPPNFVEMITTFNAAHSPRDDSVVGDEKGGARNGDASAQIDPTLGNLNYVDEFAGDQLQTTDSQFNQELYDNVTGYDWERYLHGNEEPQD
jgi:hypothetical protein